MRDIPYYILDEQGNPVPEPDSARWSNWFENSHNRILKRDYLPDDILVCTVFLGIDHNLCGRGPPVLWETMILGGPHDQYQRRYSSREAALAGHDAAVKLASSPVS
jgi:hypothetical protein